MVDDVQFVRDTLARLAAHWRIDSHRIYVAGFSNGAMMTHRLASEMSDVLAGAAEVAGIIGRDPEGDGISTFPTRTDRSR